MKEQAQLVCFNLGFLPGGERELITKPGTTIAAIQAALDIVQPSGLVSVLAYTGHPGACCLPAPPMHLRQQCCCCGQTHGLCSMPSVHSSALQTRLPTYAPV